MPEIEVGTIIGGYEIVRKLGQGGMGVVYKANEQSLNRMIALKILAAKLVSDTEFLVRFRREAQSAAQLNHPNIVAIYGIGEEDGHHYIAMEYVKGSSLSEMIRERGQLDLKLALQFTGQVAQALHLAHSEGIVHRDIKPQNIMIDPAMRVRVLDFGLARPQDATQITQEGAKLGTPAYIAPEHYLGQPAGPPADIFALGVSLYEMLAGVVPFDGDSINAIMYQVVNEPLRPIRELNPSVPQPVIEMIEKMTAKSPDDRYKTTLTIAKDIKALLKSDLVTATPTAASTPSANKPPALAKRTPSIMNAETMVAGTPANTPSPPSIMSAETIVEGAGSAPAPVSPPTPARRVAVPAGAAQAKVKQRADGKSSPWRFRLVVVLILAVIAVSAAGIWQFMEARNAESIYALGNKYYEGDGVEQDYAEAALLIRKAADMGHAKAKNHMGLMYYRGEGFRTDHEEAFRWFRKSAEQGYAKAQRNVGISYAKGEGVDEDDVEAVRWYRMAADQGHAPSQNNLALMYANGEGVAEDDEEAVRWYRKAADQGNADAQYNLAYKYDWGLGISEDDDEAIHWYRKAAENGNEESQRILGIKYEDGDGVRADIDESSKWYGKAADQGNEESAVNLAGTYNQAGKKHLQAKNYDDAVKDLKRALELAEPILERSPWDWYARAKVSLSYRRLAEVYKATGDMRREVDARRELARIWQGPLQGMDVAELLRPGRPVNDTELASLRKLEDKEPGMKLFTIPCDFGGVTHDFDVYVTEVPYPKDPMEDQARWLKERRGGVIPEDIRESFRKLQELAKKNGVSYQDLCVYALEEANKNKEE